MDESMSYTFHLSIHYSNNVYSLLYEYSCDNDDNIETLLSMIHSMISDTQLIDDTEENMKLILVDGAGLPIHDSKDLFNIISLASSKIINENTVEKSYGCDLWCFPSILMDRMCLSKFQPDQSCKVLQCQRKLIDSTYFLCSFCQSLLDQSLVVETKGVLGSFICSSSALIDLGMLSASSFVKFQIDPPVMLFMRRNVYYNSIVIQDNYYRMLISSNNPLAINLIQSRKEFERIVKSGMETIMTYENLDHQRRARAVIDYEKIITYTNEYQSQQASPVAIDVAMIHGLLRWFKCDLFKWINKPPCQNPDCVVNQSNPTSSSDPVSQSMECVGMVEPSEQERREGLAGRCELYICQHCKTNIRFPRYNNPSYLLEKAPRGRCGEFANAFALVCRSLGFDIQYVRDLTDHVWIEIWLPSLGRFVHADCCERALDNPLMYESGWGKKLTYIISFSRYGIVESTSRYSRNLDEVVERRQELNYGDYNVLNVIEQSDSNVEKSFINSPTYKSKITFTRSPEYPRGSAYFPPERYYESLFFGAEAFESMLSQELSEEEIKHRKKSNRDELQAMKFLFKESLKVEEMRGRISGDLEWKARRGELGVNAQIDKES